MSNTAIKIDLGSVVSAKGVGIGRSVLTSAMRAKEVPADIINDLGVAYGELATNRVKHDLHTHPVVCELDVLGENDDRRVELDLLGIHYVEPVPLPDPMSLTEGKRGLWLVKYLTDCYVSLDGGEGVRLVRMIS